MGLFGKYLNEMPKSVPPGFDAWLANDGGSYIAPRFMTKNIAGKPDGSWQGAARPAGSSRAWYVSHARSRGRCRALVPAVLAVAVVRSRTSRASEAMASCCGGKTCLGSEYVVSRYRCSSA